MNIVSLSPTAILMLSEAASRADLNGQRFRISIEPERRWYEGGEWHTMPATLSYKVGEGMWSPPWTDQPDPYRDTGSRGSRTDYVGPGTGIASQDER